MLIPRDLSLEECLQRLCSRNVGRLAVATPVGPRICPVNFVVDNRSVVFRTSPFGTLGTFGWGFEVAFEVDHTNEATKHGWSVVLLGRGLLLRQVRGGCSGGGTRPGVLGRW
jgi:nitroimidazol reductase NimA-like FMN-containing flavoprotein (pyridoxamine 5'-phosphate oxidase superfamily)